MTRQGDFMKNALSMFAIALGATLLACASTHETAQFAAAAERTHLGGRRHRDRNVEKIDVAKRLVTLRKPTAS